MKRSIRKTFPFVGYIVLLLLCGSCVHHRQIGISSDPRLQESFSGYYQTCENITIAFGEEGKFACQIRSREFVGHFNDVVWGTYSADSTHIYLHVDEVNADNLKYKDLPIEIADSIKFDESGDGLKIFVNDYYRKEGAILKPSGRIDSFTTSGNKDTDLGLVIIIALYFIIKFAILAAVVVLIIWGIIRLIKKNKRKQ